MLEPDTMRLCNKAFCVLILSFTTLPLAAQQAPAKPAQPSAVSLVDVWIAIRCARLMPTWLPRCRRQCAGGPLKKEGEGYILHTNVEEVVLNATVLEGSHIVQDLKKDNFQVFEDGVKQNIISFQHTDLPVSIGLVVDNSGSMSKKRPAVNKSSARPGRGLESAG